MTKRMSAKGRRELVELVAQKHAGGSLLVKRQILNELVAVTGYHRKHAIRLLRIGPAEKAKAPRLRMRKYGSAVAEALQVLWEASDRVCGKRLKALIPDLLGALENHGHLCLDVLVRAQLNTVSAATIDRMLAVSKSAKASGRKRRPGASHALKRSIPVRTSGDWENPGPGFVEADLVSHSGPTASGSFANTLTVTDVASGWTECVALVVRDGALVAEALTKLRKVMPFPLRGLDTDNGGEFINDIVIAYCRDNAIEQTRSRPYKKNDQAWVEQKNGSVVRRLVGYRV